MSEINSLRHQDKKPQSVEPTSETPAANESQAASAAGASSDAVETPNVEATSEPAQGEPTELPLADSAADPQDDAKLSKKEKAAQKKAAAGSTSEPTEEPKKGRLSRFRFSKKKDMPGGLWLKCESCSEVVFRKDLEERGRVCPACSFHFTVPGRERIEMTLDKGTWQEYFSELEGMDRLSFVDSGTYADKLARSVKRTGQNEALICGTGAIESRKVVICVLDFSFMGGSMGEVVGEKIALAAEMASERCEPLVIFTSSGGARMHEGVLSLMQMAKTCAALQSLNEAGGFSICVMTHPTTGGVTASFASVTDLVLAEPGALIGFAGPRVIATTLRQELPPGFQRAEFLLERGMIDAIVARSNMREELARLLGYATDIS